MYCGLCKSIGKCSGQCSRLALNYDLTFLSILTHNLADKDVKLEKKRCIIHWITKRPVAKPDELSVRIGALNVILAYYKIADDINDANKGRLKRLLFNGGYKKAKAKEPKLDEIVKNNYKALIEYEKVNGDSIDVSADFFGNMIKEIVRELLPDKCTESLDSISYNIGKWIYLIDALDDFDKDKKKKNYNVFVNSYPDCDTKKELIEKHIDDIGLVFGSVLSEIAERSRELDYKFNHDLIDNVFLKGLESQTKKVMENNKCKNTTKY